MNNYQLYAIVVVIFLLAGYVYYKSTQKQPVACSSCQSTPKCGGVSLLPITDPTFNLREVAKQMILLEDHLSNKGKLCQQCIIKHSLTIEAYLEEALCLDQDDLYKEEIENILEQFREIEKEFINGVNPSILSHKVRDIRKNLHVKYFKVSLH